MTAADAMLDTLDAPRIDLGLPAGARASSWRCRAALILGDGGAGEACRL
ncbi:MAG: hypothetical protein R3C40_08635 [Parvularculaceae bacterium]